MKAESDYCCTSGNAQAVIEAIPADQEILFLPDLFLGLWLEQVTGRKLPIWLGECHVHAGHPPEPTSSAGTSEAPDAELLVHPECGCASQAMAFANDRTHILSTEGMVELRAQLAEAALPRRDRDRDHPPPAARRRRARRFEPVREDAVCRFMKMITLEKVRDSLRDGSTRSRSSRRSPRGPAARSTAWSRWVDSFRVAEPSA